MDIRYARPGCAVGQAALVLGFLAVALPAQAQNLAYAPDGAPHPVSGLLTRYTPVVPHLPPDPRRDTFQGTRYDDEHDNKWYLLHPYDSWLNGGMYGQRLTNKCTATVPPYFVGSTGSTIGPNCRGHDSFLGRWVLNPFLKFQPVGMYYDRGVYTPIYDFNWTAPGPGPFPWPHFFQRPTGG